MKPVEQKARHELTAGDYRRVDIAEERDKEEFGGLGVGRTWPMYVYQQRLLETVHRLEAEDDEIARNADYSL